MTKPTREQVMAANIEVHSTISKDYHKDSHWRPENLKKVRSRLQTLRSRVTSKEAKMLDIGCGTGFLINLAKDLFSTIDGIDITDAMLEKVDLSTGNIKLHNRPAEDTKFATESFDVVTAYSFLDHLFDVNDVFVEVQRVLKKGGWFYADLNPNREFWNYITRLNEEIDSPELLPPAVRREYNALAQGDTLSNQYGLNKEVMEISEPGKSDKKGFLKSELEAQLKKAGFKTVNVDFDWFVGQGELIHSYPHIDVSIVEDFLKRTSPLSNHYFKYLKIEAQK